MTNFYMLVELIHQSKYCLLCAGDNVNLIRIFLRHLHICYKLNGI
jgi:hypothetical protein